MTRRVLFVLNAGEGGATLSAIELMRELDRRGHTCFAVLPPGASEEGRSEVASVAREVVSVHLPWWNANYRQKGWKRPLIAARDAVRSGAHVGTISAIVGAIRRFDADIVHTNTSVTLEPALAAPLAGAAHVWHIREQIGSRGQFRFWLPERALAATFTGLSGAVVANSRASAALFDRTGLGDRVVVIHNGVSIGAFGRPGAGDRLRVRLGASPERDREVLVGMVASLGSRMKRHDLFVEAAAIVAREVPAARFVIAGFDPEAAGGFSAELAYTRAIKDRVRDLGLDQRLEFAGHVSDIPELMGALDVLVHPFEGESFGRVAIEAMAARRPVVGVDGGGIAETVAPGVTGLLAPPGDAAALARLVLELTRDPARRRELGEAGRRRVEAEFSIERTTDAVEAVYERVHRARRPAFWQRSTV